MSLGLRFYGDPILREKAKNVHNIDVRHKELVTHMFEVMYREGGVGLAANQVGCLERVFVIDSAHDRHAFLNPEIVSFSAEKTSFNEACLSIPGVQCEVRRPSSLILRWIDLGSTEIIREFHGLAARTIQHELDHLDGLLFIDRLSDRQRTRLSGRLNGIRRRPNL